MKNEAAPRAPGPITEKTPIHAAALCRRQVTPPVVQNARGCAIDGRAIRHENCALSLKYRKQIEEAFGWAKRIGCMAQTLYCGLDQVDARFTMRHGRPKSRPAAGCVTLAMAAKRRVAPFLSICKAGAFTKAGKSIRMRRSFQIHARKTLCVLYAYWAPAMIR